MDGMNMLNLGKRRANSARRTGGVWVGGFALLYTLSAAPLGLATGIPVDGFFPQVGITFTNEYVDDLSFFPAPSSSPGGIRLGNPGPVYDIALLDTGAAASLFTLEAIDRFDLYGDYPGDRDGFEGTEEQQLGGATGFLFAPINDPLGLYAGGLQDRDLGSASLSIPDSVFVGQTNSATLTIPDESDLPNVVGLSFASQYATRIRNSLPQVFEVEGETVRSPAIDFHPLGSQGLGITRKAQLLLLGDSPSTPLHFPNFDPDLLANTPWENPSTPTVVQGGHFLNTQVSNGSASINSQFFFDTGASVTVLSEFKALELGFDVTLDTPEFTISVIGSGGVTENVPGFFVDELTIPALGGSLTVQNVPVIVLDVVSVASQGNIVDGLIGTNIFQGRDIVIDPNPSVGGGGPSAGLYISDPVTTDFNWSTAATSASWTTTGSWSPNATPDLLSIANVRHFAGGDQKATLTTDGEAFEVNISGASATQTMTLRVENSAELTTFSGTNIEEHGILSLGGATLDTQFVDIRDGGTLTGVGAIQTGSGTLPGQVENVGGTVAPGDPIGILGMEGRYANGVGGTLQIDLAGLVVGTEYDRLAVEGSAALAGALEVTLAGGFTPEVGDSFTFLTTTEGVGGEFDGLSLPSGYNWWVKYNETNVVLEVDSPGDFNHDGTVTLADYTVWRDNLGGLYTMADYDAWRAAFASPAASAAPGQAVPEPTAGALAVVLLALAGVGYRRT